MMFAFYRDGPVAPPCEQRVRADSTPTRYFVIENSADLRVLIAEEDDRVRAASCRVLESHGFHVHAAGSGEEAVRRHVRDPFDLILMDVRMPEMEGYRAACAIREREAETNRPVGIVGMTGRSPVADVAEDPQDVMDDCLSKPVDEQDLANVIDPVARGLLEQRGGDGERESAPTIHEPAPDWHPSGESSDDPDDGQIDVEALIASLDGDRTFAAELLASFRDTYPGYVEELEEALDAEEASGVRDAAHQLKGSLHAVRADDPAEVAESVELAARDDDLGRVRELMDRLRSSLAALDEEIAVVLRFL